MPTKVQFFTQTKNNTIQNNTEIKYQDTQKPKEIQSLPDTITFKGLSFSKKNKEIGEEIINRIIQTTNQRIAIISHKNSDIDSVSAGLALSDLIQKNTGKIADVFIEKPLQENYKFIDPEKKIKVISEILGQNATVEDIIKEFGTYDVAISLDTARPELHDEKIYKAFFLNAKNYTIDIDHHAKANGTFADVTLVDTSKKSCTQLVMEFYKPFGNQAKNLSKDFSDPIVAGIAGDTNNFLHANDGAFRDLAKLSKASNPSEIVNFLEQKSADEVQLCAEIVNNTQITGKGEIAYSIFDTKNRTEYPQKVVGMALAEIAKIKGVKYYFVITENTQNPFNRISAAVRSVDTAKSISSTIEKLGGGGHPHMCGINTLDEKTTRDSLCKSLVKALDKLRKS